VRKWQEPPEAQEAYLDSRAAENKMRIMEVDLTQIASSACVSGREQRPRQRAWRSTDKARGCTR
jgi:hypothetical protein